MPARKIGLLLLLLLVGLGIEGVWQARRAGFGPGTWRLFSFGERFAGPSFTFESADQRTLGPEVREIIVANAFGDVETQAGEANEVRVALRKVVFTANEEQARSVADDVELTWDAGPTTLRVGTNRGDVEERWRGQDVAFETHLLLELPPTLALKVENDHGNVLATSVVSANVVNAHGHVVIADVAGAVDVENRHGDLTVSQVGGPLKTSGAHGALSIEEVAGEVSVSLQNGEARIADVGVLGVDLGNGRLEARHVRGDATVRGRHAPLDFEDIGGALTAETSYSDIVCARVEGATDLRTSHGKVEASEVAGPVDARTSYSFVRLEEIGGRAAVEVDHGHVEADQLTGGASIKTKGGGIEVRGFRGEVLAEAEGGRVQLTADGPVEAPITASAKHGGVKLVLPEGGRFDLDAGATRGRVQLDVPGLEVGDSSAEHAVGRLGGGGPEVRLVAESGDVEVVSSAD